MTTCFCGRHPMPGGWIIAPTPDEAPDWVNGEVHGLGMCVARMDRAFWEPAQLPDGSPLLAARRARDDDKTPALCRCPIKELTSVGHLRDCAWVKR